MSAGIGDDDFGVAVALAMLPACARRMGAPARSSRTAKTEADWKALRRLLTLHGVIPGGSTPAPSRGLF